MNIKICFVFVICALFLNITAPYAIECPKQPQQSERDWDSEVNLAVLKIGKTKGADLKVRTNNATRDLLGKLPKADKVYLEQMMYATYCSALRDDRMLTESEKREKVRTYNAEVRKAFVDKSSSKQKQKPAISLNYMRLFGAYQVPWLMNTIYQAKYGTYDGKQSMNPLNGNIGETEPLYKFWRSWRYSQSMPLKTSLWDEYSRDTPFGLLCAACENNQIALDNLTITDFWYHYAFSAESDQELQQMIKKCISGPVRRVGIKNVMSGKATNSNVSKMYSNVEIVSQNIGFLYLIIENVSDGYLGDIRLKYKESASNKGLNLENKSSMVGCQGYNFDFSRLATPALVSMDLESTPIENQKILYGLKKGESILWLLAVYLKDDKGFPKRYLSRVVKPTQITYRDPNSQVMVTFKVRDPLGEKAAIIAVPFGWHGQ